MRLRTLILNSSRVAVGLAAIAGLAGCHKGEEAPNAEQHPTVAVKTIVVTPQAFTEKLGAIGTVTGRAGHVATLSAPAQARIAEVLVSAGQVVRAGQPLVVLDQAPFQAAAQAAEAALATAERTLERQQRLAQEGIVPRKDADQAAADVARARSEAVSARRTLELSVLRAAINGTVTRVSATLGVGVDPSQPLVEITDPSALDVLLSVTPSDAARVRPSAKVELTAGQTMNGEPLGIGTVVDVSGTVDTTTRSVAVRVRAPTTRRPLRIGETVFGLINVGLRPTAIVIPAEALVPEGDQFKVFIVDANGVAHEREVTVGGRSEAGVEITEGLRAGDRIVTLGAYGVQDSAKVVPLEPRDSLRPQGAAKPEKP
jgi:RND family efflux transporter MFP subunit